MRAIGRFLGRLLLLVLVAGAALWAFGPYEKVDLSGAFDPAALGDDLDAYFAQEEARFDDIRADNEKRVIWAGAPGEQTGWAVLYVHGFSASSGEIRPVPDRVAQGLGANLIYTRLAGHGRSGPAMAEATAGDWMRDIAEGLAAARVAGERVLVISTSTGGTLVAAAAQRPDLMERVAGVVMISPNFAVNHPLAPLATWPAARYWIPLLEGRERSFAQGDTVRQTFWTTRYPTVAAMPMAALVAAVAELDPGQVKVPALFWFSMADQVVRPEVTARVAAAWGGPATVVHPELGAGDDPNAHVVAGDIMSPGQTGTVVQGILDWAAGL